MNTAWNFRPCDPTFLIHCPLPLLFLSRRSLRQNYGQYMCSQKLYLTSSIIWLVRLPISAKIYILVPWLFVSSSHYSTRSIFRSYTLRSVPTTSLHNRSSPTAAYVTNFIRPIQYFISPIRCSLAPIDPFSPLALCAPFHVAIVLPSPIDKRSPPQSRLRPRSSIPTSFRGLVVAQNGILHIPLHVLLFSPNTYMALLAIVASPPNISFSICD